jgi:recombination protein RecR
MTPFEQLSQLFAKFPGIGRRQAKRFAYFIVQSNPDFVQSLNYLITETRKSIKLCPVSFQYFTTTDTAITTAPIVRDPNRDKGVIMIVEKDQDIENFEKSKLYDGQYFVLGNLHALLDSEISDNFRMKALVNLITERGTNGEMKEIIFALPASPDGDRVSETIKHSLESLQDTYKFTMTQLGRGFSTGSEIEYADSETLTQALENRK